MSPCDYYLIIFNFVYFAEAIKIEAPLSYLFTNGKQDANATALIERLHTSERIRKMAQARVVTPPAELLGEALIGETCFYFVPDNPNMPLHTDVRMHNYIICTNFTIINYQN